jgi:hypothetical protein
MTVFLSELNQSALCVDGDGISIAIDDRHFHVKINSVDMTNLSVELLKAAQRQYVQEKEKENYSPYGKV